MPKQLGWYSILVAMLLDWVNLNYILYSLFYSINHFLFTSYSHSLVLTPRFIALKRKIKRPSDAALKYACHDVDMQMSTYTSFFINCVTFAEEVISVTFIVISLDNVTYYLYSLFK